MLGRSSWLINDYYELKIIFHFLIKGQLSSIFPVQGEQVQTGQLGELRLLQNVSLKTPCGSSDTFSAFKCMFTTAFINKNATKHMLTLGITLWDLDFFLKLKIAGDVLETKEFGGKLRQGTGLWLWFHFVFLLWGRGRSLASWLTWSQPWAWNSPHSSLLVCYPTQSNSDSPGCPMAAGRLSRLSILLS